FLGNYFLSPQNPLPLCHYFCTGPFCHFFHIARIDRIVSRRKSAECRRPYSSKDIGWNVRFPSSASPLLHYLISKTIYKKIGPVFTTRPTWCG
ncbi:hypothetical protein, partial [Ruthenibacterium lactatiformans]|uniref:hypothetical protein n=1 Tax=Ruthenibacterium lactatiformans TaxID=1550024 RepID=UPI00266C2C48